MCAVKMHVQLHLGLWPAAGQATQAQCNRSGGVPWAARHTQARPVSTRPLPRKTNPLDKTKDAALTCWQALTPSQKGQTLSLVRLSCQGPFRAPRSVQSRPLQTERKAERQRNEDRKGPDNQPTTTPSTTGSNLQSKQLQLQSAASTTATPAAGSCRPKGPKTKEAGDMCCCLSHSIDTKLTACTPHVPSLPTHEGS